MASRVSAYSMLICSD